MQRAVLLAGEAGGIAAGETHAENECVPEAIVEGTPLHCQQLSLKLLDLGPTATQSLRREAGTVILIDFIPWLMGELYLLDSLEKPRKHMSAGSWACSRAGAFSTLRGTVAGKAPRESGDVARKVNQTQDFARQGTVLRGQEVAGSVTQMVRKPAHAGSPAPRGSGSSR